MSSLIGKRLQSGKYKLEQVLGQGGFGLTFRAHQTYLDQVVVIKTLHETHWRSPHISNLQRQFQDEARRLAMCSHPNVVRVSDFFLEDGLPYMVMDYIPGRSLYDIVIPSNPLPVKASIDYISQIGRALQAVHAKGLLHRDVKPQNIMIHELTGEAILIDFGIARELTQNPTQTHTSIVSEGYAPIEQYLPKAHRSAATDIYGLAATLYTLLTAEVPVAAVLRDRNPLTPIRQLRPDVPEPMAAAIEQGMNIELRDRPQSVGRWLTTLTAGRKTGIFGRSQRPPQNQVSNRLPNPSAMPTQVAAPGYRSASAGTESRTVAVPVPTGYREETAYCPVAQPKPKGKGLGCLSILGLLTLLIMGALAGGAYWLYEQSRAISLPQIELSLPDDIEVIAPEEEQSEPEAEEPEETENIEQPEEADLTPDIVTEPDYTPLPDKPVSNTGKPPLVLANSGNPANAQPGDTGGMVPVPGLPPGTSEDRVTARLGQPTRTNSNNGFYTTTYTLVPNRVTVAYVYDEGSDRVRQSEAAFSPSTDRFVMRTALIGMLNGRSTAEIEKGLRAVRKGDRDRFAINTGSFTGAIERNANGYIHIHVQQ